MAMRPVEWEVRTPLDGLVVAIVREVELGRRHEHYYRAVTANPDRSQRKLIGYWGSPSDAHDGVLALYEHGTGRSLLGGDTRPSRPLVPQKPPPRVEPPGMAARPALDSSRA